MPARTPLTLALLLSTATRAATQEPSARTPAEKPAAQKDDADAPSNSDADAPPKTAEDAEAAARRWAPLAGLRALEAESGELLKPIDAASAKAEMAAAAWTLDREWSKLLLRDALAQTFPAEADRARLRDAPSARRSSSARRRTWRAAAAAAASSR